VPSDSSENSCHDQEDCKITAVSNNVQQDNIINLVELSSDEEEEQDNFDGGHDFYFLCDDVKTENCTKLNEVGDCNYNGIDKIKTKEETNQRNESNSDDEYNIYNEALKIEYGSEDQSDHISNVSNNDIFIDSLENIQPKVVENKNETNNKRSYECRTCNAEFERKNDYLAHIKIHGDRRLFCEQCDGAFKTMSDLRRHEMKHIKLCCQFCGNEFTGRWELKRHMNQSHRKELLFTCRICNLTFDNAKILNKHMRSSHSDIQYNCPSCNER